MNSGLSDHEQIPGFVYRPSDAKTLGEDSLDSREDWELAGVEKGVKQSQISRFARQTTKWNLPLIVYYVGNAALKEWNAGKGCILQVKTIGIC